MGWWWVQVIDGWWRASPKLTWPCATRNRNASRTNRRCRSMICLHLRFDLEIFLSDLREPAPRKPAPRIVGCDHSGVIEQKVSEWRACSSVKGRRTSARHLERMWLRIQQYTDSSTVSADSPLSAKKASSSSLGGWVGVGVEKT